MKIKKIIDYVTEDYGIFGTYLIGSELETFGDLPTIPDGYMLYKVNCDEDIKNVKHIMKLKNEKIDELYPNSENEIHISLDDYESRCFLAMLFFENVFNYWCGKYTKIIYDSKNNHNISAFDHLSMELWNWVRDEISTEQLKRAALNFKKAVM